METGKKRTTTRHAIIFMACLTALTATQAKATIPHGITNNDETALLDTSRVFDLDEVVVISQPKEVLTLRRQPLSSTVLAGHDIDAIGAHDLSDIAAYVPSFAVPDYGSRLTSSVYVRGIGSRVNNPAVGVYIDGIPLVSKNSYNFHTYQVDRVDVLRGPQGTLYGMNTEGGLVRIYSKSPMTYQGTDIRLGIGTRFYRNAEAAHYQKLGERAAFSVAAFYCGQNGFFRNSVTGRHADTSNEAGGKARLILKPADGFTADLTVDYQYTNQLAFPYGTFDTSSGHISLPATNRSNSYRRNMLNTGLSLTYMTGELTLGSQTSYQFLRDRMDMDQDYLPQDFMHLKQTQLMNAVTQEFTVKSDSRSVWRHTTGLYTSYQWLKTGAPVYFDSDFTGRIAQGMQATIYNSILQSMTSSGLPESAAAAVIEQAGGVTVTADMSVPALFHTPQFNIGLYHESNISLNDRLTATVGLRYDYSHASITYDTSAAMAVTVNVMGTEATSTVTSALANKANKGYSQLLPKVGLNLTVDDAGSNVYAVVSKGYRAGGYNIQMFSDILQSELTSAGQGGNAAHGGSIEHTADDYRRVNRTIAYKPEQSWNYEAGAHLNLFDGRLHADVAAYYMQIRNQQLSVMAGDYGFGRMMVNAGRSRSLGLEATLRGSALDNRLTWAAAYALTDARFTQYTETDDDGNAISYEGKRIPYVPRHTLSLRADTRLPLNDTFSLIFGGTLTGQGRIYWDESNSASQPFYALLGLNAGVQTKGITMRLWCNNITSTHYATFAFSSSASGKQLWFAQRGNPIQAGLDIQFRL